MHRRVTGVFVGLVLLALLLVPAGQASHTYGHRYVVQGILLDADGNPVQNQELRITTSIQGQTQAVMAVQTHCDGTFYSPEGREIFDGADYLEGPNREGHTYFHYHDSQLTRDITVTITLGDDEWTEPFNPDRRSTVTRHQVAQTFEPAAGCSQDFGVFHASFTVHVSSVTDGELQTGENAVDEREVSATLTTANGSETTTGTTNTNGDVWLQFPNASALAAGDSVEISSAFFDDQTVTVTEEDVTYRYVDRFYTAHEPQPSFWDRFGTWIIVLGVAGVLILVYFGYQKAREKMAIRKAYERSGRKRTRR